MDTRRTRRKVTPLIASALLALAIAGCSATGSPSSTVSNQTPSEAGPAATRSASPSPTPSPFAVPATVEGEIARATFENGPDGIPTSASTTSDVLDGTPFRLESSCVGSEAKFALRTAAVGEDQRTLYEDTVDCDSPSQVTMSGIDYTGPVQLSFVDTDGIEAGWVLVIPEDAAFG